MANEPKTKQKPPAKEQNDNSAAQENVMENLLRDVAKNKETIESLGKSVPEAISSLLAKMSELNDKFTAMSDENLPDHPNVDDEMIDHYEGFMDDIDLTGKVCCNRIHYITNCNDHFDNYQYCL